MLSLCNQRTHPGHPVCGDPDEIDELAEERKKARQTQYIANKGPGVPAANTKAYEDKNLAERRFACETCDYSGRTQAKLNDHLATQVHKDKVTGVLPCTLKTRASVRNKKWYCPPCEHSAPSFKLWQRHLGGAPHAKKLRDVAVKESLGLA